MLSHFKIYRMNCKHNRISGNSHLGWKQNMHVEAILKPLPAVSLYFKKSQAMHGVTRRNIERKEENRHTYQINNLTYIKNKRLPSRAATIVNLKI